MPDDAELLREFRERGSEDAFRTIVDRHSTMVHGVALRISRSDDLAKEITQAVFVILARKAAGLRSRVVLAGWLHHTARFVALEAVRRQRRRVEREKQMNEITQSASDSSVWDKLAPTLDQALENLGKPDRDALVLRFLEQRSFADVAGALSITEAAAKMRVSRAVERLRIVLSRNGVVIPVAALLGALSTAPAAAAPSSVASAALASTVTSQNSIAGLVKGASILMAWNKAKVGAMAVLIALLFGGSATGLWLWRSGDHAGSNGSLRTFEPMAGEWEGTFTLRQDGRVLAERQPCSMGVVTSEAGRACAIELRVAGMGTQYYTHTLNEQGDRLFTISDPASGRGDGHCDVTESYHNSSTGDWRAAMRFLLPGGRGVMTGSWSRRGNVLRVRSVDEIYGTLPGVTVAKIEAEIELRPRLGANIRQ